VILLVLVLVVQFWSFEDEEGNDDEDGSPDFPCVGEWTSRRLPHASQLGHTPPLDGDSHQIAISQCKNWTRVSSKRKSLSSSAKARLPGSRA
jgi:hypothetical protein